MARNNFRRVGAVLTVIRNAVISVFRVPLHSLFLVRGDSMHPALRDGDLIHVRRVSSRGTSFARGSIVVAGMPSLSGDNSLLINVKRVVGLPGELVRVDGAGAVSIEGTPLAEPYLAAGTQPSAGPGLSWLCDDNEYFLMGDNRADSGDSRRYGPVPDSNIIGRMRLRIPTHRLLGHSSPHRTD